MSNQVQSLLVAIAMLAIVLTVFRRWASHIPGFDWLFDGLVWLAKKTLMLIAQLCWWLIRMIVAGVRWVAAWLMVEIASFRGNPLVGWRGRLAQLAAIVGGRPVRVRVPAHVGQRLPRRIVP